MSLRVPAISAMVAASVYVALYLRASLSADFDLVGGLVVIPALVLLWAFIGRWMVAREDDAVVSRLVSWSIIAKLVAIAARYGSAVILYGGLADAARYDREGSAVAASIWSGDVGSVAFAFGTRAMELITGVVFAVAGPSPLTGFVVFGLLAWLGQMLFLRAYEVWMGGERRRLYTALVLFAPTLLFWPASIGKESWMLLTLGMATLGIARFLKDRSGLVLAVLGLTGAALVRPHMSVMLVAAAAGALVLSGRESIRTSTRVLGVVLVAGGGLVLASQLQSFFRLESLSIDSLTGFTEEVDRRTSTGGSEFSNVLISNPLLFPLGFISTMLRPFPWEASNAQALLVSFEGLFIVFLAWRRRTSLRRIWTVVRGNAYAAYSFMFVIVFVVGFSNFNNFGLLARERAQVFPSLLLFLALRASAPKPVEEPAATKATVGTDAAR